MREACHCETAVNGEGTNTGTDAAGGAAGSAQHIRPAECRNCDHRAPEEPVASRALQCASSVRCLTTAGDWR
jgi:hypothetical protein